MTIAVRRLCSGSARLRTHRARLAAPAGPGAGDLDPRAAHRASRRIIEAASRRVAPPMDRVMIDVLRFGLASIAAPRVPRGALTQGGPGWGDGMPRAGHGAGPTWDAHLRERG